MIQEGNKLEDLREWANDYASEISRLLNKFCEPLDSLTSVPEKQVQTWYKEISKALSLAANIFKKKDEKVPEILAKAIQKTATNLERKVPFFVHTLTDQKTVNDLDDAIREIRKQVTLVKKTLIDINPKLIGSKDIPELMLQQVLLAASNEYPKFKTFFENKIFPNGIEKASCIKESEERIMFKAAEYEREGKALPGLQYIKDIIRCKCRYTDPEKLKTDL